MPVTRQYIGPFDEVEIPSLGLTVKRGGSIEVESEVAASLDEQPDVWAKPNTKAAKEVEA